MLNEEDQNEVNRILAINFTINTLITLGQKAIMKEIDEQDDIHLRLYFRSLVGDALKIMKNLKIPIKK